MKPNWPDLYLEPINLYNAPSIWRRDMSLTHEDVKQKLMMLPETDLLEILEISAEDIVDRFGDRIEEKHDYFINDLEGEDFE